MPSGLNQTALHPTHIQRGGRMVDFAGWSMPVQYQSIIAEHDATRTNAGLFDVSHMGRLMFAEAGAAEWLGNLLTRSVTKLKPGGVRYSLIANSKGEILDDVLVYRVPAVGEHPPHWMLVVNASNRETILQHLQQHVAAEPCDWRDVTTTTSMIAVQGPSAITAVKPLLSIDVEQLAYYQCCRTEVLGHLGWVSRTGYTGEDGCELIVPNDAAVETWEALESQPTNPVPVGLGARDTLRLEAGMPLYGHELGPAITPFQAGLGFAVNWKNREFIGRDVLAKQAQQPLKVVRVGLSVNDKRIAREHTPVLSEGIPCGEVTSGSYSPTLKHPIAMAMVQAEHASEGSTLELEIRGRLIEASVVPLPFYQRSGDH